MVESKHLVIAKCAHHLEWVSKGRPLPRHNSHVTFVDVPAQRVSKPLSGVEERVSEDALVHKYMLCAKSSVVLQPLA
tara:strand:- start:2242 stop:2472 length:231 start_codon:yes stop_codon:yes gene_type:complete